MSAATIAQEGIQDLEAQRWPEAINKLSQALRSSTSPAWLIARSRAHIGNGQFGQALRDADLALLAARQRAKRDLMADAQHRRAVAYYRLGQYADADCCCSWAQSLAEGRPADFDVVTAEDRVDQHGFYKRGKKDLVKGPNGKALPVLWTRAQQLRAQALHALDNLPRDGPGRRRVTARMVPLDAGGKDAAEYDMMDDVTGLQVSAQSVKDTVDGLAADVVGVALAPTAEAPPSNTAAPALDNSFRIDQYESDSTMTVLLYQRGIPSNRAAVRFQSEDVRTPVPKGNQQVRIKVVLTRCHRSPCRRFETRQADTVASRLRRKDRSTRPAASGSLTPPRSS